MNTMKSYRSFIVCVVAFITVGCLAPPKKHPWQDCLKDLPDECIHWPYLTKDFYSRVCPDKTQECVLLLKDKAWISIEPERIKSLAPDFIPISNKDLSPYLIRGVTFSKNPIWTFLQYDVVGNQIYSRQATYDGEILLPFRWVAMPNAFIVFLPEPPNKIYPDALLGGDRIMNGIPFSKVDRR